MAILRIIYILYLQQFSGEAIRPGGLLSMVKTFFIYVCTLVRRPLEKDYKIRFAYWLRSLTEKK